MKLEKEGQHKTKATRKKQINKVKTRIHVIDSKILRESMRKQFWFFEMSLPKLTKKIKKHELLTGMRDIIIKFAELQSEILKLGEIEK